MSEGNAGLYKRYPVLYDLLYGIDDDYQADTKYVLEVIDSQLDDAQTMLDVACGTGLHLIDFKERFEIVGVDFEEPILEIARTRHDDIEFLQADMRDFDLARTFDVVVCFGVSIGYMVTPDELNAAISSMAKHVRPGGVLLIEPWLWPERFWVDHFDAGHRKNEYGKVAWMSHAYLENNASVFDIRYIFETEDGLVNFEDHEVMGLFTDEQYRSAFELAGMDVTYDPESFRGYGMYTGKKNK